MEFENGRNTPVFGYHDNDWKPDKEYVIPKATTILKVDFHPKSKYSP